MRRHPLVDQQNSLIDEEIRRTKFDQDKFLHPRDHSIPIGVQFELTARCNLYCKHCYNSSGRGASKDVMDINAWMSVVDDLKSAGGIFQSIISGGEPLLLKDNLYKIMDSLHEDGTAFIFITNGMLVNKSVVQKLSRYKYYWAQVSIDDVCPEVHDEFRGAKGSWEKAANAALSFSFSGMPLRVAHTVSANNVERLPGMIDFAHQLGAASIVCGPVMASGRGAISPGVLCRDSDFLYEMYSVIQSKQDEYKGIMDVLSSADIKTDIRRKKETPNSAVVVRPNGDVRMDCTMPFVIGNVKKEDIVSIWRRGGSKCWNHPDVDKYISELDLNGDHPEHRNHVDADYVLSF